MKSEDAVNVAINVDRLILESRLCDISLIAQSDRSDRVGAIASVISELSSGAYLIGCGPYCCGVLPLTVSEVVLGRPPSPLESVPDAVADYTLNDAVCMVPREASRIHVTILRHKTDETTEYSIRDEDSQTGTYLNGRRVGWSEAGEATASTAPLSHCDVVSLGPSGVNSYVFLLVS